MTPDPLVAPVVGGTPEVLAAKLDELADALDHARLEVREVYVRDADAGRTCREAAVQLRAIVPRPEPREPEPELLAVLKDVLAQFDAGMFVRNTDSDGCSDWAIKAAKPLLVLARAKAAVDKADAAVRPASAPSQWTCPYCGHVEEKNHENWQRCAADHIDHCPVVVGAASAPSLEHTTGNQFYNDLLNRPDGLEIFTRAYREAHGVAASAPSRPLEDEIRQIVERLEHELGHLSPSIQASWTYDNPYTSAHATLRDCLSIIQRLRVLVPGGGDPQEP